MIMLVEEPIQLPDAFSTRKIWGSLNEVVDNTTSLKLDRSTRYRLYRKSIPPTSPPPNDNSIYSTVRYIILICLRLDCDFHHSTQVTIPFSSPDYLLSIHTEKEKRTVWPHSRQQLVCS